MNDQKMLTLARNLMRGIREQVFNLDPAACFPCPECAAASAHENYPCAACTVKGLSYIVGTATADHYYRSCVAVPLLSQLRRALPRRTCCHPPQSRS